MNITVDRLPPSPISTTKDVVKENTTVDMRLVYLRVKIKSLAAEAKIIQKEEAKCKREGRGADSIGLTQHRKDVVRRVCRDTNLAYGYLRGKTYREIEKYGFVHTDPNQNPRWTAVREMVRKYGTREKIEGFDAWLAEAKK